MPTFLAKRQKNPGGQIGDRVSTESLFYSCVLQVTEDHAVDTRSQNGFHEVALGLHCGHLANQRQNTPHLLKPRELPRAPPEVSGKEGCLDSKPQVV